MESLTYKNIRLLCDLCRSYLNELQTGTYDLADVGIATISRMSELGLPVPRKALFEDQSYSDQLLNLLYGAATELELAQPGPAATKALANLQRYEQSLDELEQYIQKH